MGKTICNGQNKHIDVETSINQNCVHQFSKFLILCIEKYVDNIVLLFQNLTK